MFEELKMMDVDELSQIAAMSELLIPTLFESIRDNPDKIKKKQEELRKKYTKDGLVCKIMDWAVGHEMHDESTYYLEEKEIVENVAKQLNVGISKSLKRTESHIAEAILEKVLLSIKKKELTPEEEQKLTKKLDDGIAVLKPKDKNAIKKKLKQDVLSGVNLYKFLKTKALEPFLDIFMVTLIAPVFFPFNFLLSPFFFIWASKTKKKLKQTLVEYIITFCVLKRERCDK